MSRPGFFHIEAYARQSKNKRSAKEIAAEAARMPGACPHVANPSPPVILHGSDPVQATDDAIAQAEMAQDALGRRLKSDALIMVAGAVSYPIPRSEVETNPASQALYAAWEARVQAFVQEEYGSRLRSLIRHEDEQYLHLHAIAVPHLQPDGTLRIGDVHPGLAARYLARAAGASMEEQQSASDEAMRSLQDRYFRKVSEPCGHTRHSKRRPRGTRSDWRLAEAVRADAEARFATLTTGVSQLIAERDTQIADLRRPLGQRDEELRLLRSHVDSELETVRRVLDEVLSALTPDARFQP
jgi:hypothetical protein